MREITITSAGDKYDFGVPQGSTLVTIYFRMIRTQQKERSVRDPGIFRG